MGAAIAVDNGDAHLRHDLGQAEVEGVKHVGFTFFRLEIAGSFERQPGTNHAGSIAEDDGGMMQVAAVAGFYCEAGLGADTGFYQRMMNGAGGQGHRDRQQVGARSGLRDGAVAH